MSSSRTDERAHTLLRESVLEHFDIFRTHVGAIDKAHWFLTEDLLEDGEIVRLKQ